MKTPAAADASGITSGPPALIATADDLLLDDLLRLAAAAGVTPRVESDLLGIRRAWPTASLVLVGHDLADRLAGTQPVRRTGVVVVGNDLDDATIYQVAVALGAEQVVMLPDEEAALADKLADSLDGVEGEARSAVTLACIGGRGGAGASTFAAGLGVVGARRGLRTMLIDGDPLGGGIDLLFGGEQRPGTRWPELVGTAGRVNAASLRAVLPSYDELAVLSWDRDGQVVVPPEAMRSVLGAAQRGSDLVVVDLPRRRDDAVEEALVRSTSTLLVVPRDVRSCAAAKRVVTHLGPAAVDLRVVARELGTRGLGVGDVADHLGLPLAGEIGFEKELEKRADAGRFWPQPRDPIGRACADVLDGLGLFGRVAA